MRIIKNSPASRVALLLTQASVASPSLKFWLMEIFNRKCFPARQDIIFFYFEAFLLPNSISLLLALRFWWGQVHCIYFSKIHPFFSISKFYSKMGKYDSLLIKIIITLSNKFHIIWGRWIHFWSQKYNSAYVRELGENGLFRHIWRVRTSSWRHPDFLFCCKSIPGYLISKMGGREPV